MTSPQLRPDGGPATPRVIMLSSRRGAAVNLPPSAPVDEVLAKPIIAEQLHSVIQRILRPTA